MGSPANILWLHTVTWWNDLNGLAPNVGEQAWWSRTKFCGSYPTIGSSSHRPHLEDHKEHTPDIPTDIFKSSHLLEQHIWFSVIETTLQGSNQTPFYDHKYFIMTCNVYVRFRWGFAANCTSPNEDFNQIENWKCHMFDFWLIPLDRITYGCSHIS